MAFFEVAAEIQVLRLSLQVVTFFLAGFVISLSSHAVVVKDLFSAEVTVADNSSEALSIGARVALAEVLVKTSGSEDVLQNPTLLSALKKSRSLVQQYAYIRKDARTGELLTRFEFDEAEISKLISRAGVPLWTANRPSVLVWMVVEGPEGRQFVNNESSSDLVALLSEEFSRRGVPARFPLYDLNDAALISVDDLWRLDADALAAASARYGLKDTLAGRFATLSTGSGVGDWSYLSGNSRIDRSIPPGSSGAFLQAGVSLVAEEMSERYAIAPSSPGSEGVTVQVTGVTRYADYAGIVSWLQGLELIELANVETIRGDTIQIKLAAQADAEQLAAIIELNKHLVPVRAPNAVAQLSYRWQK